MRLYTKYASITLLVILLGCQSKTGKIEEQARDLISLKNYDLAISLLEKEVQNYPKANQFYY